MFKRPAPTEADDVEDFTLDALTRTRTLVITYDGASDTVDFEPTGLTPLEVRGIVAMAYESLQDTYDED